MLRKIFKKLQRKSTYANKMEDAVAIQAEHDRQRAIQNEKIAVLQSKVLRLKR